MRILITIPLAVACSQATVGRPLCDDNSRPACGNIGQAGAPEVRARSLLALGVNEGEATVRPLLDLRDRPAAGNCGGKGGCKRGFDEDDDDDNDNFRTDLAFEQPVEPRLTRAAPAYLAGSRIATLAPPARWNDERVLVIDEDSGMLILANAEGRNVGYLEIGAGAGLLAYDPIARLAYVADRRGNQVVVVRVTGEPRRPLSVVHAWATPIEPYGVALAPDRRTLLVTAVADRVVVAYDPATGHERWRTATSAEPRGIAISGDGKRAAIASLVSGGFDQVDLATHALCDVAITLVSDPANPAFARGAFALTFLGDRVVMPFQEELSGNEKARQTRRAYGVDSRPIRPELTLAGDLQQRIPLPTQLPRALAWDGERDVLYVAGAGNDQVVELARVSSDSPPRQRRFSLTARDEPRCGPSGIAVTGRGVVVWCAFTRRVFRIEPARGELRSGATKLGAKRQLHAGVQLVPSALPAREHAGMVAFHVADGAGIACAACHPEGRSDGVVWIVNGKRRQTPVLAGRLAGTAPFKWDGTDLTLHDSVARTARQLGDLNITVETVDQVTRYLESMPAIAAPLRDQAAIARGGRTFDALGCDTCHDGATYTDRATHELGGPLAIDTPSLRGLAASAPYYHDGSAATLADVLRGHGSVQMTDVRPTGAQLADLVAFLETR